MTNDDTCNEELYNEVAEKLNISPELVKDIVNAQSLTTVKNMKNLENTRYVYLGAIKFNKGKFLKLNSKLRTFKI